MNRYLFRATLAISTALGALAPLCATPPAADDPLVAWVQKVNARLDKVIASPAGDTAGIVRISFRRGPRGMPTDVVIHAANSDLRRATQQTIERAGTLPPLPVGYAPDTQIGMQLLFSSDEEDAYLQQRKALLASAAIENHQVAINQAATRVALNAPRN